MNLRCRERIDSIQAHAQRKVSQGQRLPITEEQAISATNQITIMHDLAEIGKFLESAEFAELVAKKMLNVPLTGLREDDDKQAPRTPCDRYDT